MTRNKLILTVIGLLYISILVAQSVSKELATLIAVQYIKNDICNVTPSEYSNLIIRDNLININNTSVFSLTGKASLYVVQLQEGWVLVASEYIRTPVLASSSKGQFPEIASMPDGFKSLLTYYEEAVAYARDSVANIPIEILQIWEDAAKETMSNNDRTMTSLPSSYEISDIRSRLWNQSNNNDFLLNPDTTIVR